MVVVRADSRKTKTQTIEIGYQVFFLSADTPSLLLYITRIH